MRLQPVIKQALAFLTDQQQANGGFKAYASSTARPFVTARQQPTVFPTILILDCLTDVTGASLVAHRAASYVRRHMSEQGSWNYWETAVSRRQAEPYPDDLDDTACAVAALSRHDPSTVGGTLIGQFARLLVASEQQAGGPYNTWLIDPTRHQQWRDIDMAVNANIGYALSLQSVTLAGLNAYVHDRVVAGNYRSKYYDGPVPVLYFLSRWYRDEAMLAAVERHCQRADLSTIEATLLLSMCCQLKLTGYTDALAQQVLTATEDGHWPAAALYIDPVYDGRQHYGGSAALSTAFAVEALSLYQRYKQRLPRATPIRPDTSIQQEATTIASPLLRRQYRAQARLVGENGRHITHPVDQILAHNDWSVDSAARQQLNLGSINGWLAYTIYDDILDGAKPPDLLNVANVAARKSYAHFLQALPEVPWFHDLVRQTFDGMDAANAWELAEARATRLANGDWRCTKLPDYGDHRQLAERSQGHGLTILGAAAIHYKVAAHPCFVALQTFTRHFLIARQLNDDAHDWEDDSKHGRLTAVVAMLLHDTALPHTIRLKTDMPDLQQTFWRQTIDQVALVITEHTEQARQALQAASDYMDCRELQTWLDSLQQSADMALRSRDQTLAFMESYGARDA